MFSSSYQSRGPETGGSQTGVPTDWGVHYSGPRGLVLRPPPKPTSCPPFAFRPGTGGSLSHPPLYRLPRCPTLPGSCAATTLGPNAHALLGLHVTPAPNPGLHLHIACCAGAEPLLPSGAQESQELGLQVVPFPSPMYRLCPWPAGPETQLPGPPLCTHRPGHEAVRQVTPPPPKGLQLQSGVFALWHMPLGGTLRAQDTHRALDQSPLCGLGGPACPHQTQAGMVAKHSLSAHPTGKWLRRTVALSSLVCMPPQPRRGLGYGALQAARPCGMARWAAGREGPMTLAGRQPHFLSRSYCPAQATPTTAWWVNTHSPLQIPEHMPKQLGLWLPNPFNSPTKYMSSLPHSADGE